MGHSLKHAIFLDLDGTLADTAADLFNALSSLCKARNTVVPDFAEFRQVVSLGAAKMLQLAFDITPSSQIYEVLRLDFLRRYRSTICENTEIFPGIRDGIRQAVTANCTWGIITNKPGWLTTPLICQLAIEPAPCCIISGDTLTQRKPAPDQLLHACAVMGLSTRHCVYVGDAKSDILAAKAADMQSIAVTYGYVPANENPYTWGADRIATQSQDVFDIALKMFNLREYSDQR